jgi:hypothetical protein
LKILGILNEFIEKNPDDASFFLIKTKIINEDQAINQPKPLFKEISHEENEAFKAKFGGIHEK